ncbi:MAG TPA: ABC transporter substrate-binding protein [Paracoccaceae bacterium]|nr:ABC transporter substrate-binding protein [Paracoccaceae bacterium]
MALWLGASPLAAEVYEFPAPGVEADQLRIYSTLDAPLAGPLIEGFQAAHPQTRVIYEELLSGEVTARIVEETDKGEATADFAFSSAMDAQVKLANDGYAMALHLAGSATWPRWANWRDMAYALTFEPGVLVYHKPTFPDGPPQTRRDLMAWLRGEGRTMPGRIGTYDIERSAVGYLFLARDTEHFADVWSLVALMAVSGLQTFATSQEIIDRVADGRLALGYNILGSYAADQARAKPDLGLVLLKDYTVVVSRVALVPRAAGNPDSGAAFLSFLMSREGQEILSDRLRLAAISLEVSGDNSAQAMQEALGDSLRPVSVSPGLLVYLDQAKRQRLIRQWRTALGRD